MERSDTGPEGVSYRDVANKYAGARQLGEMVFRPFLPKQKRTRAYEIGK